MQQLEQGRSWLRRAIRLTGSLLLAYLAMTTTVAADDETATLEIAVRGEHGVKFPAGKVLICPEDAACIELAIDTLSSVHLDRTLLTRNCAYTVLVYAADNTLRYSDSYWLYDSTVAATETPELTGLLGQSLRVVIPPLMSSAADSAAAPGPSSEVTSAGRRPTRFMGAVLMPFMLGGNFGTDPDAFGGVTNVAAGWGFTGSYRFGYPRHRLLGRRSISFQELTVTYAQNRYHVDPIQVTDEGSDLTLHRFYLAYGLGRFWQRSQGTLAFAASYAGLYDGSTLVEYGDRSYGMFGLGLQARYIHAVVSMKAGVTVGLLGQFEIMYYFADAGDNDHWYGWEPSVAIGVAVY